MLPLQDPAQTCAIGTAGSMGLFSFCQHSRLDVVIFAHNVLASDLISHWAAVGISIVFMNYQCFQEVTFFLSCSLFAFWRLFVLLSKILAKIPIEGKG